MYHLNDRNRKLDIFDHEEVSVHEVLSHLDVNSSDIVSMPRLAKFDAANSRPRTLLVKFRIEISARKVLVKASLLNSYLDNTKVVIPKVIMYL